MECRRTQGTAVVGELRSPTSVSRRPLQLHLQQQPNQLQQEPHQLQPLHRQRRRLYDCDDEHCYDNNNVSATNVHNNNTVATTTTLLVDELEQLRTDNFQLRLRVYNAERRVDRLSAAAELELDRDDSGSDSETCTSGSSSGVDDEADAQTAAAATATATAAVRTIHDLLTVNRRLLALLAATVSAKAVAVSADDKRRWRRLRNHIESYAANGQGDREEEEERRQDDDSDDSDSETGAPIVQTESASAEHSMPEAGASQLETRSPTPPPPKPDDSLPAPDDDSAGSELSRLRARCRRLERSLQQLVNTELWARNRQIGKLEQQRYVTQVASDAAAQKERPAAVAQQQPARPTGTPKGILVMRPPPEAHVAPEMTAAAGSTITTPPPVLPDYSEVNFFFSCDEEEEDDDQRNSETNTQSSASIEEDTESDNVRPPRGQMPVRSAAIREEAAGGAPVVQPRKRQCRPHHRPPQPRQGTIAVDTVTATTTSSSSLSADCAVAAAVAAAAASDLSGDGRGATPPTSSSRPPRHRTSSGTGRQRPRRRYRPRRCSKCARRDDDGHPVPAARTAVQVAVADAQVQCSDDEGILAMDDSDYDGRTIAQLRKSLEARRHENSRLYGLLLLGRSGTFMDDDRAMQEVTKTFIENERDSPEPFRRLAQVLQGRIEDILPLCNSQDTVVDRWHPSGGDDDGDDDDDDDDGTEQRRMLQIMDDGRQSEGIDGLRERIVSFEQQELSGNVDDLHPLRPQSPNYLDDDDVLRLDRAGLINVALPNAVNRLRRALGPFMQRLPEEQQLQLEGLQEDPREECSDD